jgi:hypothetical protein
VDGAVTLNAYDVKSHDVICVAAVTGYKQHRRAHEFALLVVINRQQGGGESARAAVPHLDKSQALLIQHDEIDFAAAAAEVASQRTQAMFEEVSIGPLFRAPA